MKTKIIITSLAIFALATSVFAGVSIALKDPVASIFVNQQWGGDYQVYEYNTDNKECLIVVSVKYATQTGISCLTKEK